MKHEYFKTMKMVDLFLNIFKSYTKEILRQRSYMKSMVSTIYLNSDRYLRYRMITPHYCSCQSRMFKRVLTADNVKETGKIKILKTTDSVSMVGPGYLCRKRKRASGTSWYRGIPCSQ